MKADSGEQGPTWVDDRIDDQIIRPCGALGVSAPKIWLVRRRFVEQGLDAALNRHPQPERPSKRNGMIARLALHTRAGCLDRRGTRETHPHLPCKRDG